MNQLIQNRWIRTWLAMQGAVYLSFLAIDLFIPGAWFISVALKYLAIVLCLVMAISSRRFSWNRQDSTLLIAALSFTCAADLFLLILNMPVPGLLSFCAVHVIYVRRYRPSLFLPAAAIALPAASATLAAGLSIPGFPMQLVLSGLYGVLILTVTACAFFSPLPRQNRRLVCAGMVLFLLCDIHVALFNTLPANNHYFPFTAFLMWFFYLPSQVLLSCSSFYFQDIAQNQ